MNDDDDERRLAELVEQAAERLERGEAIDWEAIARDHGALVDELRSLWPAIVAAHAAARWSSEPTLDLDSVGDDFASGELPDDPPNYHILGQIGRGGMGAVYRARQLQPAREVALKMILQGRMASANETARFRAEAEAAARLDHPNIVPIYEVGEQSDGCFFSMKLVDGQTLSNRLSEGPLPPREAAALLSQIARAIHYAHCQGVLHRDLKPSNLLIDGEGRPHVTDFGLAKQISGDASLTQSGAILGTPSYMSPEQAAGRGAVGPASDVYSLGCVLYQTLVGRPPFQAASPVDTLLLVLEQEPAPPREINALVDRDLEMIALKCLQKPPELRYVSAAALADDLDAFLADEPISARSGRFSQIVARMFRRSHHAEVLENWGLLWIWHSAALLALCLATNYFQWRQNDWELFKQPWPYLALWGGGLAVWAPIFWALRRRAGPVTFVERQIAHVWGASVISSVMLFGVEFLLRLPVLTLSPVLGLINGMVFTVKAGVLSGEFYWHAAVMYATAVAMALLARYDVPLGVSLFGVSAAATFFFPGLKYLRQRRRFDSNRKSSDR